MQRLRGPDPRDDCHPEDVHLLERLITAPKAGVFYPTWSDVSAASPGIVTIGDEVGVLVQGGEKQSVRSPFTGLLMGLLALAGERVQPDQPVAWLTTEV